MDLKNHTERLYSSLNRLTTILPVHSVGANQVIT